MERTRADYNRVIIEERNGGRGTKQEDRETKRTKSKGEDERTKIEKEVLVHHIRNVDSHGLLEL